jgi:hypothetical protein
MSEMKYLMKFQQLTEPDFTQDSRLPAEVRNYYRNDCIGRQLGKVFDESLNHMTVQEWNRRLSKIEALFMGR